MIQFENLTSTEILVALIGVVAVSFGTGGAITTVVVWALNRKKSGAEIESINISNQADRVELAKKENDTIEELRDEISGMVSTEMEQFRELQALERAKDSAELMVKVRDKQLEESREALHEILREQGKIIAREEECQKQLVITRSKQSVIEVQILELTAQIEMFMPMREENIRLQGEVLQLTALQGKEREGGKRHTDEEIKGLDGH